MKQAMLIVVDLAGITLMSYAAWLHYPPLGFGLAGFMLWGEANNVFARFGKSRTQRNDR